MSGMETSALENVVVTDKAQESVERLQARVDEIQWFHSWPLLPGVRTKGVSPMLERLPHFCIPDDLSGKRVLDVGCADGFFSFLAESRGADVVAIDSWPRQGFFLAHELLNSKVEFHHANIYDIRPDDFGWFDIVFFFGVYYHLKNPILALERIASLTREWALIESQVMIPPAKSPETARKPFWKRALPHPPASLHGSMGASSHFFEHDELNRDPTNWWVPTIPCLLGTIRAAGFPVAQLVACYDGSRAVARATKGPRTAARQLAEDIIIAVDRPRENERISGPMLVEGWALSQLYPEDGITSVRLYLDNLDDPGFELGLAERGAWRPDQTACWGDRYGSCGYRFQWNPQGTALGTHTLHVLAEGMLGWNYRSVQVEVSKG
jgi:tRNA (mo5U34)-methyltransferase